jgi:hypothetical protein
MHCAQHTKQPWSPPHGKIAIKNLSPSFQVLLPHQRASQEKLSLLHACRPTGGDLGNAKLFKALLPSVDYLHSGEPAPPKNHHPLKFQKAKILNPTRLPTKCPGLLKPWPGPLITSALHYIAILANRVGLRYIRAKSKRTG